MGNHRWRWDELMTMLFFKVVQEGRANLRRGPNDRRVSRHIVFKSRTRPYHASSVLEGWKKRRSCKLKNVPTVRRATWMQNTISAMYTLVCAEQRYQRVESFFRQWAQRQFIYRFDLMFERKFGRSNPFFLRDLHKNLCSKSTGVYLLVFFRIHKLRWWLCFGFPS